MRIARLPVRRVLTALRRAGYYVIGILVAVVSILFTVYHKQIVAWLQPAANWMHK